MDARNGKNASRGTAASGRPSEIHHSQVSHPSHSPPPSHPIIPPRGDYRTLLSFQKAEVVFDITFRFTHKHLDRGDRTVDQMNQAARSGKKNICEGSKAGRTSKEMEIKLTNTARASLEELLDDFLDYLRIRNLRLWDKDSKEARYVRALGRKTPQTYELYREFVETRPPEVVANITICLIHQANYLIDQQLKRLEQDFVKDGGLRERMTRARLEYRNGKDGTGKDDGKNGRDGRNGKHEKPGKPDANTAPGSAPPLPSHPSHDSQPSQPSHASHSPVRPRPRQTGEQP